MIKSLVKKFTAGLLVACATSAMALPVTFNISGLTLTPGGGYGTETESASSTLLDVLFVKTFTSSSFNLTALSGVGSFNTFKIGTVSFRETNDAGGILLAETDDLGVMAAFTFLNPLGVTQSILAVGNALTGGVNTNGGDGESNIVDYTLTWSSATVLFGNGGSFAIELAELSFDRSTGSSATKDLMATVRLISDSTPLPANGVPEPGTLLLVGAALGMIGVVRRRRS